MGKWLVIATAGLLVALALIWMQIREPQVATANAAAPAPAQAPAPTAKQQELAKASAAVAEAQKNAGKIDPATDAFTYHWDEVIPGNVTSAVAHCYEDAGGLRRVHRNQKVRLDMTISVKDGLVSVSDVIVDESTINDKAMVDCFVREATKVTWRDDELPDYKSPHEQVLIRPERGMKKFTKANREYEGDGPIGKLNDAVMVPGSREMPKQP